VLSHAELLLRIAVGALFGAIIGLERDSRRRHQAGLRTHLIVSMASATFTVVSAHFAFFQGYGSERLVVVDPSRIAASVVTGIGFLAGGAILRTGSTVQGLTTAAGLWLVTSAGMCAGAGMYAEGAFVTLATVLALTLLRPFEHKDVVRRRVKLVLDEAGPGKIDELVVKLTEIGTTIDDLEYEKRGEDRRSVITFDVRVPGSVSVASLIRRLEAYPGVSELTVCAPA
jgi:putative Mg2+ transporter-C (MgtC) family protein